MASQAICQAILKSGTKKGAECGRVSCKIHAPRETPAMIELRKTLDDIGVGEYARLVKTEADLKALHDSLEKVKKEDVMFFTDEDLANLEWLNNQDQPLHLKQQYVKSMVSRTIAQFKRWNYCSQDVAIKRAVRDSFVGEELDIGKLIENYSLLMETTFFPNDDYKLPY